MYCGVHANEFNWQRRADEFFLNPYRITYDFIDSFFGKLVDQLGVQKTGKVSMQAFISGNQLIGEAKAWHEPPFLEPEDRAERPWEEYAFNRCKGHKSLAETLLFIDPVHSPLGLLMDAVKVVHSIEQKLFLVRISNVSIDQQRISLRVNVLHRNLEAIKAS